MKNLMVHKKIVPHVKESKLSDLFSSIAILALFLAFSPLILIIVLVAITSATWSDKDIVEEEPIGNWFLINTPGDIDFSLSCTIIDSNSISEAATGFFDNEQLYLYRTAPPIKFFEGYFTNFRMEWPGGIFLQKIYFNDTLEEVVSMPLYLFDYQTTATKEIHDLKEYILSDIVKGNTDNLLFTASGEEHDLEIIIVRS